MAVPRRAAGPCQSRWPYPPVSVAPLLTAPPTHTVPPDRAVRLDQVAQLDQVAPPTRTARPDRGAAPSRRASGVALAGCLLALFAVAAWSSSFAALAEHSAARLSVAVVAGCVLLCVRAQPRGVWACSSVYLITLSVFHFGVAALFATGTSFDRIRAQYDFRWLGVYPMSRLFAVATLGVVSAAVGVAAMTCLRAVRAGGESSEPAAIHRSGAAADRAAGAVDWPAPADRPALPDRPDLRAPVGFALLAVSVLGLVAIVLATGGIGLLFGSYAAVGETALRGPLVPYVLLGLGLGLVLAVIGGPSRWRTAALVVFALFAVVALPLGLRGEVMFPAVAAAAVAARRRIVVRGVVVLLGAVILLALIGGLREIRQSGLAATRLGAITFSPVDGIAELGASIRPIGSVLEWRDEFGERPPAGSTFYGQIDRLVSGRLLGLPQPPQFSDERLFNVLMLDREGPIGGSPIAEAYYNFGARGVVGFLLLTGLVVAWMDHGRSGRGTDTACLVLLVPLITEVRNAFAAVPVQVMLGLGVLGLTRAAEIVAARTPRTAPTRARRDPPRPSPTRPRPPRRAGQSGQIGRPWQTGQKWQKGRSGRAPVGRPGQIGRLPEQVVRRARRAGQQSLPAWSESAVAVGASVRGPWMTVDPAPSTLGRRVGMAHPYRGIGRVGAVVTGWLGLSALASLGQAVVTARMLPLSGRGALVVLLTVSALGSLVGGLGTNVAFRHYFGRGDPRVSLGDYLGLSAAAALPAAALITVASLQVIHLSGGARVDAALVLAIAVLAAANLLAVQVLDALNAAGSIVLAAGLVAATGLAQLGLLLAGPRHPSLAHILVILALCWAAQAVTGVTALARMGLSVRPRADPRAWRLLVVKGVPALGLNVGATMAFRFDRLLVAAFGGAGAAAVYSIAAATGEALRLLPGSVGQVVFHRAARGVLSRAALRTVTRSLLALLLVAAAVLALAAPWLVRTLFGPGYAAAVTPMRLLLVAELLLAPFLVECRALTGLGRTGAAGGAGLLGLAVSLATYPVLVPWRGPAGAAIGSMLAYALMTALARRALRGELVAPFARPAVPPTVAILRVADLVSPVRTRSSARAGRGRSAASPRKGEALMAPHPARDTLVVEPTAHGGRLVFYRRAADAAYWDELWDAQPADYRRARAGHLPLHLRRAVRRHLRPGGRVLEAGCGPGQFSVAMAARGFAVEAVDWAPRAVERLRAAAPEIRVWQGDVRRLDVPDGRYDAVYSPGVCEHFEDGPQEVLRETLRVLRPGGIALVSTPCFSPLLRVLSRGAGAGGARAGGVGAGGAGYEGAGVGGAGSGGGPVWLPRPRAGAGEFYQYAFTPAELAAVLRAVGFERVRAHPYGALATALEFTAAGRAVSTRVPRPHLRPLEAALDLLGAAHLSGRACLWVARRPAHPPGSSRVPRPAASPAALPSTTRKDRSA
ncbi:putative 3-demethylubiquinone-9 3-O-methyltransferase [Frankia alni ACN14a]|uniref:3-demethylubiquinone-9 3-O-methyltransferase n=1 Tax=Frankia alni (strain DSM 45986 / CECT 9034 / ACN14a) TaxID=326424 RepID=Q0RP23_FRAAA|nr:putative 3-demethylubiquinone-9 3-O-methyltransferase [Frankia alni ACN14a]